MSVTDDLLHSPSFFRGRVGLCELLRILLAGKDGDVIIQAFTCVAVVEAVIASGAKTVFADIEADGFNLDPASLEARVNSRTRAIVVQHTFGIPAQMDRIMEIASRHGVPVIEDCCHTFYSRVNGRAVGEFGAAAFYSFEWGKPVIVGLGGIVIARDPALRDAVLARYATRFQDPPLAAQLRLELQYRAFQLLYRPSLYWFVRSAFRRLSAAGVAAGSFHDLNAPPSVEFGWRMAPILRRRFASKLKQAPRIADTSRALANEYRSVIRSSGVIHPTIDPAAHVLVRYPLRVAAKREVLEKARAARVEMAGWYETPVHPIPLTQLSQVGLDPAECPEAVRRCAEIVSLPLNDRVSKRLIEKTAAVLDSL